MKTNTLVGTAGLIAIFVATLITANAQGPGGGRGRGMPAEARETIHDLFDSHNKFQREVVKTDDGYTSKTTSKDPAAVKILQTHVKQMEKRLKQGLMVRRWDPAYEEFVSHYDDIQIKITNIDSGISIAAVGATEDAKKVARNHAGIISKFIAKGWSEHDKTHPAVLATGERVPAADKKAPAKPCCLAAKKDGEVCDECARSAKPVEKKDSCPACDAGAGAGSKQKSCCKDKSAPEKPTDTKSELPE